MQFLVMNSFSKAGSQFLINAINHYQPYFLYIDKDGVDYIDKTMITKFHIYPLIHSDDVNTVVIIRDPYESLADLFASKFMSLDAINDKNIKEYGDEWLEFLKAAKECAKNPNIYLVDHKKLMKTPTAVCLEIFKKFNMLYDPKVANVSDKALIHITNTYMDYVPEKNPLRNSIMKELKGSELMEDYFFEYEKIQKIL